MMLKTALTSLLFVGQVAFASAPSFVTIDSVEAHGTGCPVGTAHVNVSPDRQVFTAIFDSFQAKIDPQDPYVSYSDRQKRCDLSLQVRVPAGWQFSIFRADYEGWYDLQRDMSMTQTSTYHFQGNNRHTKRSVISTNAQPKSGNFTFRDEMGVASLEWSACGAPRNMFISSELRLSTNNPSSRGVAGIDAIEGNFQLQARYALQWRQCR